MDFTVDCWFQEDFAGSSQGLLEHWFR